MPVAVKRQAVEPVPCLLEELPHARGKVLAADNLERPLVQPFVAIVQVVGAGGQTRRAAV